MAKGISVDELAEAVQAELDAYVGLAPSAFEAAGKAAGKKAVKRLKSDSPIRCGAGGRHQSLRGRAEGENGKWDLTIFT